MPRILGEGIAQSKIQSEPKKTIRIGYSPTEAGLRILRTMGLVKSMTETRAVENSLGNGQLGIYEGSIWVKDNDKAKALLDQTETQDIQTLVQSIVEPSLRSLEFPATKKLVLVRTKEDMQLHQIWLAKDRNHQQLLEDGLFCLHFHQPARGSDGHDLTKPEIEVIVANVGYHFLITHEGQIQLPQIAES